MRSRLLGPAFLTLLTTGALAAPASAFNDVADGDGTCWGIQDAAAPRVDTGSIRATQTAPGNTSGTLGSAGATAPYSTTINGFGGIKVWVSGTPAPRFNGALMRGFGLTFDSLDRFATTKAIKLGPIKIQRSMARAPDAASRCVLRRLRIAAHPFVAARP